MKFNRDLGWKIFLIVILALLWQGSQYLISSVKTDYLGNGLVDLSFRITESLNAFLAGNPVWTKMVFIFTSLEVDLLVISIILFSVI
jgi:hypothetical protein